MEKLIYRWHTILDMPKRDLEWHTNDVKDEMEEYKEAPSIVYKWSELSDVVYTCTRAQWSGHKEIKFPFGLTQFFIGALYMIPKYSLRWGFFRKLGRRINKNSKLHEVRNPTKVEKLEHVARKYNLDPEQFKNEAQKMLKYWVLLK